MSESARKADLNGWYEIKGNPLSKVGVFPYSGAQVGLPDRADEVFMVYRPEEELSNEACIESFRLVPWIEDHTVLGSPAVGATPAEEKGVHGVTGDNFLTDVCAVDRAGCLINFISLRRFQTHISHFGFCHAV